MATRNDFLSLRSSCERCRFHKLKCTLPSDGSTNERPCCTRCSRAKVECVFGRRARGRKHHSVSSPRPRNWGSDSSNNTHNSPLYSGDPSELCLAKASQKMNTDQALNQSEGDHEEKVDFLRLDSPNIGTGADAGWAEPGVPDLGMFYTLLDQQASQWGVGPFDTQGSEVAVEPLNTTTQFSTVPSEDAQRGVTGISEPKAPDTILRLSTLVAKIHETINTLHGGPWASIKDNNTSVLDDYPIGRILQLSQEFSCILRNMQQAEFLQQSLSNLVGPHIHEGSPTADQREFSTVGSISGGCEARDPNQRSMGEESVHSAEGEEMSTPTGLLILSSYISLTNLYGIALAHFENHLREMSETPVAMTRNSGLRLGELPGINNTWTKTGTAIRLLLDALQSAEDAIGIQDSDSDSQQAAPGHVSEPFTDFIGELSQTVLKKCLFQRVQSVKQLLWERMSL